MKNSHLQKWPKLSHFKFSIPESEALQTNYINSIHDSHYVYSKCLRHLNNLDTTYLKPFKDKADQLNLYHIEDIKHEEKQMTQYIDKN